MRKITIEYKDFPQTLKDIENPPMQLYCEGNISLLKQKSISIIGSRCCSEYGVKMCAKFSRELTEAGLVITSGMAKGIDTVAHSSCLQSGGKTIAVLGCGLNKIFPKENTYLYKEIIYNDGLVISEYEPETEAESKYFPQRNRIVSGLSVRNISYRICL